MCTCITWAVCASHHNSAAMLLCLLLIQLRWRLSGGTVSILEHHAWLWHCVCSSDGRCAQTLQRVCPLMCHPLVPLWCVTTPIMAVPVACWRDTKHETTGCSMDHTVWMQVVHVWPVETYRLLNRLSLCANLGRDSHRMGRSLVDCDGTVGLGALGDCCVTVLLFAAGTVCPT